MRRRGGESKNILASPGAFYSADVVWHSLTHRSDIRSLFILLLLSFVDVSTSSGVKAAFLEQRRDLFMAIFKGITDDPYPLARRILEVCWSGIWSDPKIKRTLKVSVFQESTVMQVRDSVRYSDLD